MNLCSWLRLALVVAVSFCPLACKAKKNTLANVKSALSEGSSMPHVQSFKIIRQFKHDPNAITQGLVFHNGFLYESTGGESKLPSPYGQVSSLRRIDIATGEILENKTMDSDVFAEGIAIVKNRLYQLTYRNKKAFAFALEGTKIGGRIKEFDFGLDEGWGLASDGTQLVASMGSSSLFVINPDTFDILREIRVKSQELPIARLNELEFVHGEVYANVFQTNYIARIDYETGKVNSWIDLTPLAAAQPNQQHLVLNGIAYDPSTDHLFVTGKFCNAVYEIELIDTDKTMDVQKSLPLEVWQR